MIDPIENVRTSSCPICGHLKQENIKCPSCSFDPQFEYNHIQNFISEDNNDLKTKALSEFHSGFRKEILNEFMDKEVRIELYIGGIVSGIIKNIIQEKTNEDIKIILHNEFFVYMSEISQIKLIVKKEEL